MKSKIIEPIGRLAGEARMPGDKSISHRAVMLGAIARGRTKIKGLLDCDDCAYTIDAFREMGIDITRDGDFTLIDGNGLKGLKAPKGPIYVGNSGTTMRLLAGILAGQNFEATLEGDRSLTERPMRRITEPLSLMGVDIKDSLGGYPPLKIKGGRVMPVEYKMPIASAQVKSSVLFAGLYVDGFTRVEEPALSRDHTERMMRFFGANIRTDGLKITLEGLRDLKAGELEIPGDISSASFLIVAALILKNSKIRIRTTGVNPTRAGILNVLSGMGARIRISKRRDPYEPAADIEVVSGPTRGIVIDRSVIPSVIDELPVIFVLASLSQGPTVIRGAEELRVKETDRIRSMSQNLAKMGAKIEIRGSDIVIEGAARLKGSRLESFGDHRTCMAMAVAALAADGESEIDDVGCVNKSFPEFFDILERLRA